MMKSIEKEKTDLIRITAWIPQKQLKYLMKEMGGYSQSEALRLLVEREMERMKSLKAHEDLYGIAKDKDFDDRLL